VKDEIIRYPGHHRIKVSVKDEIIRYSGHHRIKGTVKLTQLAANQPNLNFLTDFEDVNTTFQNR
jgi:hypothetical protein